jgi:hypothetical protein
MNYILTDAKNKSKRFMITTPEGTNIQFGSRAHENFTIHGDEKRKTAYLKRHSPREDWTESGIDTAGFWARYLLWNEPTIDASIKDIEKRFGIKVQNKIQKPSAYRSMRFGQKKSGNDEGGLRQWIDEDWINLTALVLHDERLLCGTKAKEQTKPTVCRPTKSKSKTVIQAQDLTEKQILEAIRQKEAGKRIDWSKL